MLGIPAVFGTSQRVSSPNRTRLTPGNKNVETGRLLDRFVVRQSKHSRKSNPTYCREKRDTVNSGKTRKRK